MISRHAAAILFLLACAPIDAQQGECCRGQMAPPAAAGKAIELKGTVGRIQIVAGQGMPYFELKHGAETTRVYLGPMPFLIAQNVNPKSGQEIAVRGYKVEDWVLAARITFVNENRTVKFRDDQGWPVWRGTFGRRGGN